MLVRTGYGLDANRSLIMQAKWINNADSCYVMKEGLKVWYYIYIVESKWEMG